MNKNKYHFKIILIKIETVVVIAAVVTNQQNNQVCTLHSALKLEKSEIPKVQKSIICILKNGKKSIFAPEKCLKLPKSCFF